MYYLKRMILYSLLFFLSLHTYIEYTDLESPDTNKSTKGRIES